MGELDTLIDTLRTLADTASSVLTVVKPDTVLDTLKDTLASHTTLGELVADNLGLVYFALGIIATIVVGLVIYYLQKKNSKKAFKELKEEINILKKGQQDMSLYLNGISEVRDKKKAVIYRNAFKAMNEYRHADAIAKFKECLKLETDASNRCVLLNLIGLSQRTKGDTREAEQTFSEMIGIAEQAKLNEALAAGLGNIGNVYQTLGQPHKALEYHQRALKIGEQMGREIQVSALSNIGIVYDTLGDRRKALEYHQWALKIAGNREVQASILGNIGNVYRTLGDPRKALENYQRILEIHEKMGDLGGQAKDLSNIGLVYVTLGKPQKVKALEYFERTLELAKQIKNPEIEAVALGNIGNVYRTLGNPHKALEYYERVLNIDEQTGRLESQANALGNIGVVYHTLGDPRKALEYYEKALEIAKQIGDREGQANQLVNIGGIYAESGQFDKAIGHLQRARELFAKIEARDKVKICEDRIVLVKKKMGK